MDSLRNVIEKNVIYIGISFFVVLALVFFLGVVVGPKINRGSYRMSAALPTPEAVSAKEPSLEEEPKKEAQEKEEPQTSTQAPETLKKDEAETAEMIVPVPAAEEIFSLGEGIYRETSSAKGKISVSDDRSWYEPGETGRWLQFFYRNISNEVLDTEWAVVWKDAKGNILRTDKGKHFRSLPNDFISSDEIRYPEKAVSYELWIEVERSSGIPASITVNYLEDPLFEGSVLVDYELKIKNEGTPKEQWLIEVKIENITENRTFKDVAFYLREKDKAGEIVPVKKDPDRDPPDVFTEENFYLLNRLGNPIHILRPQKSETFRFSLPYETVEVEFYLQGKKVPFSLAVEFSSTSGEIELIDYTISESYSYGYQWKVQLVLSGPPRIHWVNYVAHYIIRDASGEILEEGDYDLCAEPRQEGGQCKKTLHLLREAAKLQLIERIRE